MQVTTDTTLTPDQEKARSKVLTRVLDQGKKYTSLRGYAGTGKTFLSAQLIRDLGQERVYGCAPTHKATYVLGEKIDLEVQTVHSLLGLTVYNDTDTGRRRVVKKKGFEPPEEGVVLLDESSMVGSILWRYVEESGLQWVFVGDPAQLPPVAQRPSEALQKEGATLETIVRQEADNPILEVATAARHGEPYLFGSRMDGGRGVGITSDSESFKASAESYFRSDEAEDRPPRARVLAYRNATVKAYNREIRARLHETKSPPRFMKGDWLMLRAPYFDEGTKKVVCQNSEEVKVLRVDTSEKVTVGGLWRIYDLTVRCRDGEARQIPVLHEGERARYHAMRNSLKKKAKKARQSSRNHKSIWSRYYRLDESFAKVDYAFAMTVHKSQGSTFHTAFVDHRDLQACTKPEERQALVYVAATRPSHRLALLV